MNLSMEQQEELTHLIKKKEMQLRRENIPVKSSDLWYKAILTILKGGTYQAVLESLKSYPQEIWFVA